MQAHPGLAHGRPALIPTAGNETSLRRRFRAARAKSVRQNKAAKTHLNLTGQDWKCQQRREAASAAGAEPASAALARPSLAFSSPEQRESGQGRAGQLLQPSCRKRSGPPARPEGSRKSSRLIHTCPQRIKETGDTKSWETAMLAVHSSNPPFPEEQDAENLERFPRLARTYRGLTQFPFTDLTWCTGMRRVNVALLHQTSASLADCGLVGEQNAASGPFRVAAKPRTPASPRSISSRATGSSCSGHRPDRMASTRWP